MSSQFVKKIRRMKKISRISRLTQKRSPESAILVRNLLDQSLVTRPSSRSYSTWSHRPNLNDMQVHCKTLDTSNRNPALSGFPAVKNKRNARYCPDCEMTNVWRWQLSWCRFLFKVVHSCTPATESDKQHRITIEKSHYWHFYAASLFGVSSPKEEHLPNRLDYIVCISRKLPWWKLHHQIVDVSTNGGDRFVEFHWLKAFMCNMQAH